MTLQCPSAAALPRELSLDRPFVERTLRTYWLARWVPTVLHDAQRLPQGGALLVGNHGPLAMDTGLLVHALHRDVGRVARSLTDRFMFQTAFGRRVARSFGGVEGTPENAGRLLAAGEWVLVYPGGARETMRSPAERYQLCWEGRFGFARTALQAQVPIVPVACIGLDEPLRQLLTREQALRSLPGRLAASLLGEKYVPPVFVPRARRTPFHYWFGEPVEVESIVGLDAEQQRRASERLQQRVKSALEDLIARGREERRRRLLGKRESAATPVGATAPAE